MNIESTAITVRVKTVYTKHFGFWIGSWFIGAMRETPVSHLSLVQPPGDRIK